MSEGEIKDAGVNENSLYSGTNDDLDQDIGKKSKFLHDQVSRAYEENYTVNMVATEKSISHESMTSVSYTSLSSGYTRSKETKTSSW